MSVKHLPLTATPEQVSAALTGDGAVIVDELISSAEIDSVAAELRPYLDSTGFGHDEFSGQRTKHTGGLVARSPKCRELVMHPLALGTCRKFLRHATTFQLHLTQVIDAAQDALGKSRLES